jgi:hypothetical protein
MPGVELYPKPKNQKEDLEQRREVLFHNVLQFVELNGDIPDLKALQKPVKKKDKQFDAQAKLKGVKVNRNKRAMMYTLSGPAFAYAGAGVAGLLVGATNPFGWAVAASAVAGWALWKDSYKIWRNARAGWLGQKGMTAIREVLDGERTLKELKKTDIERARFWLQKRRISKVSDDCKVAFERVQALNKVANPKACCDACLLVSEYFKLGKIGGILVNDVAEFRAFDNWRQQALSYVAREFTPKAVCQALHKIADQVWKPGKHSCKKICYSALSWKPEKSKIKEKGAPAYYTSPFGRVLLDAANRVVMGKLGSKFKYSYEIYGQVVGFAETFGMYEAKFGGPDGERTMLTTGYPKHPKGKIGSALAKIAQQNKSVFQTTDLSPLSWATTSMAQSGALVPIKQEVAKAVGHKFIDGLSEGAYASIMNTAQGLATGGGGAIGWAADAIFHKLVDGANTWLEKRALKQEMAKEMAQRDLSRTMTSLRTLLKGEGKFEEFGTQFGKVIEHLNAFIDLNAKAKLSNCDEAYDLAFHMFEVQKHIEKAADSQLLLNHYAEIVEVLFFICSEDDYTELGDLVEKSVTDWLTKHPKKQCKGVCYHPAEGECVEVVDAKGNVVAMTNAFES